MKTWQIINRLMDAAGDPAEGGGSGGGGGDPAPKAPGPSTLNQPPGGDANKHWSESLGIDPDLAAQPFVREAPDVKTFIKNAIETKKLVGANTIKVPGENATPEEVAAFYEKLGRPSTADDYNFPQDFKLNDGIEIPEPILKEFKEQFHKLGLSKAQGDGILQAYGNYLNQEHSNAEATWNQGIESGMAQLREMWGDETDANIDIARGVVKKFGDEQLVKYLDDTKLGNHPTFIKLFADIGKAIMDDTTGGGKGLKTFTTNAAQALVEISSVRQDAEFMKALTDERHPGHKETVKRWTALHEAAYGNDPIQA